MNQIEVSIENAKRAPRVFITKSGVNLRLRSVSPFLIMEAQKRVKKPEVPTWFNEAKSRNEENPNDPAYLRSVEEYNISLADAFNDTYLANGVTVLDPLPDDVSPLDSDEWADGIRYIGIDVPASGFARKIAWLRWYVINDMDDLMQLVAAVSVASGLVQEEQVAQAVESFRSDETRPVNNIVSFDPSNTNGDQSVDRTRDDQSV